MLEKRFFYFIITILIMGAIALQAREPEKNSRPLDFKELQKTYKNQTFQIQITAGAAETSPESGKRYAYLETVLFQGNRAYKRNEFQVLYHTDAPLQFKLANDPSRLYSIMYRLMRPALKPQVEKVFKEGMRNMPKHARHWVAANKGRPVIYAEYGLQEGRLYYARFHTESYQLPPDGPEGKPLKKTNTVLVISDRPIRPDQWTLTPMFQNWTY